MTLRPRCFLPLVVVAALACANACVAQTATAPEARPDPHSAAISRDWITTKLQDAGYTNVHDVEMQGGVWKAEANDSSGADVEIKLDAGDGHILGSGKDADAGKQR